MEGIEDVKTLVNKAAEQLPALRKTLLGISREMDGLNIKISQPTDGPAD